MTISELSSLPHFKPIAIPAPTRQISGAYIGDLLSWVMGRAGKDSVWLTIMSNVNVLAVASLADVSAVIFTEGVIPDDEIIITAKEIEINLISTELSSYSASKVLATLGI